MEEEIKKLKSIENNLQKRMKFLSIITDILKNKGEKIILVGGQAAEFYTLGTYLTEDMDILCENTKNISELLNQLKFQKTGRIWYSDELNIAIDLVGPYLVGSKEKLQEIEIEGRSVWLIGIEDLIIDRLNSFINWNVGRDGLVAKQLILLNFDNIDWKYLEKRADEEAIRKDLDSIKKDIEKLKDAKE